MFFVKYFVIDIYYVIVFPVIQLLMNMSMVTTVIPLDSSLYEQLIMGKFQVFWIDFSLFHSQT